MPSAAHPILVELTPEEIETRLSLLKAGVDPDADELLRDELVASELGHVHYTPWVKAADEYIHWSQNPDERIYSGVAEFDQAMRGLAPGELMLVVGYAHGGKTLFTQQLLLENQYKRVAVFTPDETRVSMLVKMASIVHGLSAEELELRLAQGEPDTEELLRDVARLHFPQFCVFDEITDLGLMDKALDECVQVWDGREAQLVVIDYAELVTGAGEDTRSTLSAIKGWGKRRRLPLVVLHQTSRSGGADGRKIGMGSGGYGGEQQATFLVGVRRKRSQYDAIIEELDARLKAVSTDAAEQRLETALSSARYERDVHRNTVTFSLLKNKRPPCRLVEDTDFVLDPDTGRIRRYRGEAAHAAVYEQDRSGTARSYKQGAMQ